MSYKVERKAWRCDKKCCRKEISIKKDSFFYKQMLSCSEILFIGYLWLQQLKVTSIQSMTGHSKDTITAYVKYYRQLVMETLDDMDMMIGGPGIEVEIDESKLGKRKYHRGHRVEGVWVLGGVERTDDRKMFLSSVPDRSTETLMNIIVRHVHPDAIILTDLWRGYNRLSELGFEHRTVNHSSGLINPEDGTHTNTIEGTWNGVKLQIAPRNRTKEDVDEHLLIVIWRRKHKDRLWDALLDALRTINIY
jgi:transposase-like protein